MTVAFMLAKFLDSLFEILGGIGATVKKRLDRWLKIGTYETDAVVIARHRGLFWEPDCIEISRIPGWWTIPEMGFEIVDIELEDGSQLRWLDTYGDLRSALRSSAEEKEVVPRC